MWLLSSLSACRFLNRRIHWGTSDKRLLSSRSSVSEIKVPAKAFRLKLLWLRSLFDSWRDWRPGRRWRKEKAGMWWMLLCWRDSLRKRRGRLGGTWVNWLWERSKVSKELRGYAEKEIKLGSPTSCRYIKGCVCQTWMWLLPNKSHPKPRVG